MPEDRFDALVEKAPYGFVYHEIITQEGIPVDFKFLNMNPAFEEMMGLRKSEVLGRKASEVFSGIQEEGCGWLNLFGEIVLQGKDVSFQQYIPSLKRWFEITAYSDRPGYFAAFLRDITSSKSSEEKLQENEEKYRSIIKNMTDALLIHDFQGTILESNGRAQETLGYTEEEFSQLQIQDLNSAAERKKMPARLETLRNEGQIDFEGEFVHKDGTLILAHVHARVISYNGKEMIQSVARDISRWKHNEQLLIEKSNTLMALNAIALEQANVSTYEGLLNLITQQLDHYTGAFLRVFSEYDRERGELQITKIESSEELSHVFKALKGIQLLNSRLNLGAATHQEMISSIIGFPRDLTEATQGMLPPTASATIETMTGLKTYFVLAHVTDDQLYGTSLLGFKEEEPLVSLDFLESFAHISAISLRRKKAEADLLEREEQFRSLVENLNEIVFRMNTDNHITYSTLDTKEFGGYGVEEVLGANILDFVYAEDQRPCKMFIDSVLQGEIGAKEFRFVRKDTTIFWQRVSLRPLFHGDSITGVQGVFTDITDRKKRDQRIEANKRKMEALHQVALELANSEDEDDICRVTVEAAEKILSLSHAVIGLLEGDAIRHRATSGGLEKRTVHRDRGIIGKTLRTGQSYLLADAQKVREAQPQSSSYHGAISVPVGDFGVFQAASATIGAFNTEDLEMAELLIAHTQEAIKRVRGQKNLREREEENRALLSAIPDLMFLFDREGVIIDCKAGDEALLYRAREEFLHQPVQNILPAKVSNLYLYHLESVFLTGELKRFEYVLEIAGEERHFEARLILSGRDTALAMVRDITEKKQGEEALRRLEWMLDMEKSQGYVLPGNSTYKAHGDVREFNTRRQILNSIDQAILHDIAKDVLLLLGTSISIMERNGDYVFSAAQSGYCRLLETASRDLCDTEDTEEALQCGKWLCHESCQKILQAVLETGQPVDMLCDGGISIYGLPIWVNGEISGSINIGYGDPPQDIETLRGIARRFELEDKVLEKEAKGYETRPPFIINLARERLRSSARLIGALLERKLAEDALGESENKFRQLFEAAPISLWEVDFSRVKARLEEVQFLQDEDMAQMMEHNTERRQELANMIHVVDVNRTTLKLYGARNKEHFKAEILTTMALGFDEDVLLVLQAIAQGRDRFFLEMTHTTLEGEPLKVQMYWSVAPGFENTLGRVLISVVDITKRMQAEKILAETKNKVEKLHKSTLKMSLAEREEEVYQHIVDAAEEILEFSLCTVDVVEDEYFVVKATSRDMPEGGSQNMHITEGIAGKTYQTGQTQLVQDIWEEQAGKPVQPVYRSLLSTPMRDIGIFQAASKNVDEFSPEDVNLTEILISHAAEAIHRIRSEQDIRYMSFHDSLTGLYNRAFFEQELQRLNTKRQLPLSIIMVDINGLKLVNDAYGHLEGDSLLKSAAQVLKRICREEDILARWGGDEFVLLLPRTSKSAAHTICSRIMAETSEVLLKTVPLSMAVGVGTKERMEEEISDILALAEQRMYRNKLSESRSNRSAVLTSLTRTLEEKSWETESHIQTMLQLAQKMADNLGLLPEELNRLHLLISLHDIGKILISQEILNRPGPLTEEEWEQIKAHPETGYRIARSTEEIAHIAEDILSHHERWDGSGYPRGLKGKEIPLLARINAIVDAYDVMIKGRPYKEAMSQEEAREELRDCAGTQFDPDLVEVFLEVCTHISRAK